MARFGMYLPLAAHAKEAVSLVRPARLHLEGVGAPVGVITVDAGSIVDRGTQLIVALEEG
jgi:hypothetical protein